MRNRSPCPSMRSRHGDSKAFHVMRSLLRLLAWRRQRERGGRRAAPGPNRRSTWHRQASKASETPAGVASYPLRASSRGRTPQDGGERQRSRNAHAQAMKAMKSMISIYQSIYLSTLSSTLSILSIPSIDIYCIYPPIFPPVHLSKHDLIYLFYQFMFILATKGMRHLAAPSHSMLRIWGAQTHRRRPMALGDFPPRLESLRKAPQGPTNSPGAELQNPRTGETPSRRSSAGGSGTHLLRPGHSQKTSEEKQKTRGVQRISAPNSASCLAARVLRALVPHSGTP